MHFLEGQLLKKINIASEMSMHAVFIHGLLQHKHHKYQIIQR